MPETPQTYANHVRWHKSWHFFLSPVLLINLIIAGYSFLREPNLKNGWAVLMAMALVQLLLLVRTNPLKVQDRVIRLEERLRYERTLPPELARRAAELPTGKIVALRFAADEELPGLITQVLDGKLTTAKEIKQAVRNWRGDYLRV
jgi:hypothetical protein